MNEQNRETLEELDRNERWLAGFSTPGPSAESIRRAKAAASDAFSRLDVEQARPSPKPWHGVLAAAATIALAVGIGWYGTRLDAPGPARMTLADAESILPGLTGESDEGAVQLAYFDENLSELEAWSTDESWDASGASLFEAMNDVLAGNGESAGGANGKGNQPS